MRDHADGRDGVIGLDYEAYEAEAAGCSPRSRPRPAGAGRTSSRVALLHRTGELALSEPSVAVVVSRPHRAEAFEAARFCIDTLKETRADLEAGALVRRLGLGAGRAAHPARGRVRHVPSLNATRRPHAWSS